jgi:Protein of unknown function (DUF1501)
MNSRHPNCTGISRRTFLADTGMGFTGLALSAMLFRDGRARGADPISNSKSQISSPAPRAKSVIWIFLCGGVSHVESFDIKPAPIKYAGKSISDTPFASALDPSKVNQHIVGGNPNHGNRKVLMPLNTGYQRYGQCGLPVGDWFKHIGQWCADDIAVVRSLWTIHNDHGAQLTFQNGRHPREGGMFPTLGSWITYGLSTLNQNLPEFVVLGKPTGDCCGGAWTYGAGYLGPQYAGVRLGVDPKKPLPFLTSADPKVTAEEQAANLSLVGKLNRLAGIDYPDDKDLQARIKSYELAFQMQRSVPDTLQLEKETEETRKLYGLDQPHTKEFGTQCLVARRLVERGVRFVQLFHGGGGGGDWDAHANIKDNHTKLAAQVDQPIAALIQDLKRRGMLDETIVVFGTEFGRSPGSEGTGDKAGRDHHPNGFSAFLAGGGIKGGVQHGATDEIGFHAVENPHYVTDIHATVLHQLGLEPGQLEIPGRKRLDMDRGEPIREIIA